MRAKNSELHLALASTLRELRQDAGFSQEELAYRADLHRTYISLLERAIKLPTLDTLFRISGALSVRPDLFVAKVDQALQKRSDLDSVTRQQAGG